MMTIIGVHIQIELKIAHSFPIIAFGNTIYQNNNLSYFWLNSTLAQKSPVCQYSLAWISSPHEMGQMIVSPPPCFLSCLSLLLTLRCFSPSAWVMRPVYYRHRLPPSERLFCYYCPGTPPMLVSMGYFSGCGRREPPGCLAAICGCTS